MTPTCIVRTRESLRTRNVHQLRDVRVISLLRDRGHGGGLHRGVTKRSDVQPHSP